MQNDFELVEKLLKPYNEDRLALLGSIILF